MNQNALQAQLAALKKAQQQRFDVGSPMFAQQFNANSANQSKIDELTALLNSPEQQVSDAMFKPVKKATFGRANELRDDPVNAGVIKYLQGVMGGQQTPFSDDVVNALQGQQARGSATAQEAQMQQLREAMAAGGGSIYDPGYQAASRELDAQRQGRNQDYAGQLRAQAALENFNARSNAANNLAGINSAQNAQINQLGLAGAGFQSQRFLEQPTPNNTLMPQYQPQMPKQASSAKQEEPGLESTGSSFYQSRNFSATGMKKPDVSGPGPYNNNNFIDPEAETRRKAAYTQPGGDAYMPAMDPEMLRRRAGYQAYNVPFGQG